MPDNEVINPNLATTVAQGGVADEMAGSAYSGVADSSTAGEIAFGGPTADFIRHGVVNGVFAQGPPDTASNIEPVNNPLPYWYGPVQSSGGAITCQWATDASAPSGRALRFSIAAGAAADKAYVEQIIPVGGFDDRIMAHRLTVAYTNSGATTFTVNIEGQYLTVDGTTTGSAFSTTTTVAGGASSRLSIATASGAPSDAYTLRVRAGIERGAAATTDSGTIDFTNIRVVHSQSVVLLPNTTVANTPVMVFNNDGSFQVQRTEEAFVFLSVDPDNASGSTLWLGPGTASIDTRIYRAGANQLALQGGFITPTVVSPVVTAATNDWGTGGGLLLSTAAVITADLNAAARTITGIDATPGGGEPNFVEGQRFILTFTNSGGGALTLTHASGLSAAGNRFSCPNAVNYVMPNPMTVEIIYLPTISAANSFRVIGPVI